MPPNRLLEVNKKISTSVLVSTEFPFTLPRNLLKSMFRWVGRVVLVTGASAGIGAGICRELVRQGMVVVGCARNVKKIEDISKEDEMLKSPGKLHAIKCDLSIESDILSMHEKIRSDIGRLDVCINNGITSIDSALLTGETKDWRYMLDVGILGLCINTREAVKSMQFGKVEEGHIIQMGSVVGHKVPSFHKPPVNTRTPLFHIYNGMKFMTRALAEGLRQELKAADSNIRVSLISPGAVETEILARSSSPEFAQAFYDTFKCLQPQDIADAVTYVLGTPPHVNVNDILVEPRAFTI